MRSDGFGCEHRTASAVRGLRNRPMERQASFSGGIRRQEQQTRRTCFWPKWSKSCGGCGREAPCDRLAKGERGRAQRTLRVHLAAILSVGRRGAERSVLCQPGEAGLCLHLPGRRAAPDETTIVGFPHWLERHGLGRGAVREVGTMLEERSLLMRQERIVAAAPSLEQGHEEEPRPGAVF